MVRGDDRRSGTRDLLEPDETPPEEGPQEGNECVAREVVYRFQASHSARNPIAGLMRLCIVPMKPLEHAKARLSDVLSPAERRALSLAMLEDVVRAATALDAVWVLNSDDDAAVVAARAGGEPRPDPTPSEGLNASL